MGVIRRSNGGRGNRLTYRRSLHSVAGHQLACSRIEMSLGTSDPGEAQARALLLDRFAAKLQLLPNHPASNNIGATHPPVPSKRTND